MQHSTTFNYKIGHKNIKTNTTYTDKKEKRPSHPPPFLIYYNNPCTMNINFRRRHSLDNRYPRNNGPFLLHLVEEHQDRRLVVQLLRSTGGTSSTIATQEPPPAASSSTIATNTGFTTITRTNFRRQHHSMVSLHHRGLEQEEHKRHLLVPVPSSSLLPPSPPSPTASTSLRRIRGRGEHRLHQHHHHRLHSIDAGGGVITTGTSREVEWTRRQHSSVATPALPGASITSSSNRSSSCYEDDGDDTIGSDGGRPNTSSTRRGA